MAYKFLLLVLEAPLVIPTRVRPFYEPMEEGPTEPIDWDYEKGGYYDEMGRLNYGNDNSNSVIRFN